MERKIEAFRNTMCCATNGNSHYKKGYFPPHLILPITTLISVEITVAHI